MAGTIIEFFRSKLAAPPPLPPMERAMAKRWVKERLKQMYPELRGDPRALEAAYQGLSLEPKAAWARVARRFLTSFFRGGWIE